MLRNVMLQGGEHLVVGDFNLHHPLWGGTAVERSDAGALQIVETIEAGTLQLLSVPGVPTREKHGNQPSTLDLTLATPSTAARIAACEVNNDILGSDHLPITTTFLPSMALRAKAESRRSFKKLDTERVAQGAQEIQTSLLSNPLSTIEDIDHHCKQLTSSIQNLISETVPLTKNTSYAQPWWNNDITAAIRKERHLRRHWRTMSTDEAWYEVKEATKSKKKLIREAKRAHWRASIHEAATSGEGIWRIAKWARAKSHLPPEPAKMPDLLWNNTSYRTPEGKAEALGQRFYPRTNAKLDDIDEDRLLRADYSTEQPYCIDLTTTTDEIQGIITRSHSDKAPGNDTIPNRFLKAMGTPLIEILTRLFNACLLLSYFPRQFRQARTIVLRKPGKPNYSDPGAWRPIALLNTIGKVLETVLTKRVTEIAEINSLLPKCQMGNRKGRSTDTALELLLEQVHTVWGLKKVASVLSLDIAGAFDTVNHIRLLENLRAKGLPRQLIQMIRSFLDQRKTTLMVDGMEIGPRDLHAGVPQGSPLSPILFLFYNGTLLDRLENTTLPISPLGFADDTNLLAFGDTTSSNCNSLEEAHRLCEEWAESHGMTFALQKYTLTHFTRRRHQETQAPARLGHITVQPSPTMRILGVLLDSKLNFRAHCKAIVSKMGTQLNALYRTTASTWGATLLKARQLYLAIIRSSLTYGAVAWHRPDLKSKGSAKLLQTQQNTALRIVLGAFRRCKIALLHTEAYIPPLHLWLNGRVMLFHARIEKSGIRALIRGACYDIQTAICRTSNSRLRLPLTPILTPSFERHIWAFNRLGGSFEDWEGKVRRMVQKDWANHWADHYLLLPPSTHRAEQRETRAALHSRAVGVNGPPTRRVLQLHAALQKAESTMLIHIRTGCIGLKKFLYTCRVPDIDSPMCDCRGGEETAEHVVMLCPKESHRRYLLHDEQGRQQSWSTLTGKPLQAKRLARWLIESDRIKQFSLAKKLLYGADSQDNSRAEELGTGEGQRSERT